MLSRPAQDNPVRALVMLAVEQLYDLATDPGQIVNLAGKPKYATIQKKLNLQLRQHLERTKDPRALGLDAPWDFYPYYGLRRNKNWQVDPKP